MSQKKIKKTIADKTLTKVKIITKGDNDKLTRMAIEEIYRETTIRKNCAKETGASGWLPCPLRKTNKRFLTNTINSVITYNKRKTISEHNKSTKRLKELNQCKISSSKHSRINKDNINDKVNKRDIRKFGISKHVFKKPEKKKK